MKKWGLLLSLFVLLSTVGLWVGTGAHMGWSQNRVAVVQVDPITELEFTEYEEKFVAGIEVLGGGLAVSFGLGMISLFFGNRKSE